MFFVSQLANQIIRPWEKLGKFGWGNKWMMALQEGNLNENYNNDENVYSRENLIIPLLLETI